MNKSVIIGSVLFLLPFAAFAQGENLVSLIDTVSNIIDRLVPLFIAVGLLVFFWGLIQYIRKPEDPKGRQLMAWGLITLFIMVSVWGLVKFIGSALGIQAGGAIQAPGLPR